MPIKVQISASQQSSSLAAFLQVGIGMQQSLPRESTLAFLHGRTESFIERVIQRPRLSRIFGAFRSVQAAKHQSATAIAALSQISTFWTVFAMRLLRVRKPLISFSFHFAKLPTGIRLRLSRWAFSHVERFGVHSTPERARYAQHFGIPAERFDLTLWGVRPSSVETLMRLPRHSIPRIFARWERMDAIIAR